LNYPVYHVAMKKILLLAIFGVTAVAAFIFGYTRPVLSREPLKFKRSAWIQAGLHLDVDDSRFRMNSSVFRLLPDAGSRDEVLNLLGPPDKIYSGDSVPSRFDNPDFSSRCSQVFVYDTALYSSPWSESGWNEAIAVLFADSGKTIWFEEFDY